MYTFALRFNQLIEEEKNDPTIREKLKTVAVYMRSAKSTQQSLDRQEGIFGASASKIAEKANYPINLEKAYAELSAYDDAAFNEFYGKMKNISKILADGVQKAKENPQWFNI